jgi:hypothetical protein
MQKDTAAKSVKLRTGENHKAVCQRMLAGTILVGRVPWSRLRAVPTANSSFVQSARLAIYDEIGTGKSVDYPELRRGAKNTGLRGGGLEHHHDNTEGSYWIVPADRDHIYQPGNTITSRIVQLSRFRPDLVTGLLKFHPRDPWTSNQHPRPWKTSQKAFF